MNSPLPWLRRFAALSLVVVVFFDPEDIGEGFKLLRWVVTIVAAWQLWEIRSLSDPKGRAFQLAFASIAILFNPIQPFYFERDTWIAVDAAAASILLCGDAPLVWRFVTRNSSRKDLHDTVTFLAVICGVGIAIFLFLTIPVLGILFAVAYGFLILMSGARKLGGPELFKKSPKSEPEK